MLKQAPQKRTTVTIDDRRAVLVIAAARKPRDVVEVPHEAFIRNALKDRLGWPRREPASQQLKDAAKHLAANLVKRDLQRIATEAVAQAERAKAETARLDDTAIRDALRRVEMSLKEHLAEMGADEVTIAQVKN